MLTDLEKKTAQAIVGIFETSKFIGAERCGQVTLLKGDTGGLTYGKHQTTLNSGNLYLLIKAYCDAKGKFGPRFKDYLDRLLVADQSLNTNGAFHELLRSAGDDETMQRVQEEFFDRVFWEPAVVHCERMAFTHPLSFAVVYDSIIHGSFTRKNGTGIREVTNKAHGLPEKIGEKKWVIFYNQVRRGWLATHSNKLLNKCVYRQDTFTQLIERGNWNLILPLNIRGVMVTAEAFKANNLDANIKAQIKDDVVVASAETNRVLRLGSKGDDVKELQAALKMHKVSGVFDDTTFNEVVRFQKKYKLVPDGIVGNVTRAMLNI